MTRQLVLHIGLMKTGTTYLQRILSGNRAELSTKGWSYPGHRLNQQHEMYHLCGSMIPWVSETRAQRCSRMGRYLLPELCETSNHIILSSEALSSLDERGIDHVIRHIGSPHTVVLTVRNLGRLIPSAWGQYVKSGGTLTLSDFVEELRKTRGDAIQGYWREYAYGRIVKMWSSVSGSPVALVVVPKHSERPQKLWALFTAAARLPEITPAEIGRDGFNRSLSRELTEVLRLYNETLKAVKKKKQRNVKRREFLNTYLLPVSLGQYGNRIDLTEAERAIVRAWNVDESGLALAYAHQLYGDARDLDED